VNDSSPDPIASYLAVLEELLALRANGPIDEDEDERLTVALNDWRSAMTVEQEAELEPLVVARLVPSGGPSAKA
jgi:hypothetical protein